MSYFIGNTAIDPTSETGQKALAAAHRNRERVTCGCCSPRPRMYVAAVNGRFIVKRMPSTGDEHAPGCASFLPPDELSGLSQVQGSAIKEEADTGITSLRVDFPLMMSGMRAAPPEPSQKKPTEAKVAPKKLRLTALLHYLWHEAELVKWFPAMEGKRWWGVVHRAVSDAAQGKVAKSKNLAEILYIPEPWKLDTKADHTARRERVFRSLRRPSGRAPLGILVAEYKTHEHTRLGAKFLFKQIPDCPFFADDELTTRFEKVFADQLMLADMAGDTHIMAIATFSIARKGYPVLQEIGLMLVNKTWIPFEHMREFQLLQTLTASKRAFLKSLRFNLDVDAPIASCVLTDLQNPVSLFVSDISDSAQMIADLHATAEEGAYRPWLWLGDQSMPDLPHLPQGRFQ